MFWHHALKFFPSLVFTRRIYINIAFVWLWSTTWGVIEISLWDVGKKIIDETASLDDYSKVCISASRRIPAFAGLLFLQGIFLPIILVVGLSGGFFYLLHKRLVTSWSMRAESQIGNHLPSVSSSVEQQSAQRAMSSEQRKQYIKPAVVLSVLVSAMAICTFPYGVYV